MMRLSDIDLHPDDRTLRQFAAACIVFLGGVGAWKLYRQGPAAATYALMIFGFAVGAVGLMAPRIIRLIYAAAMIVAFPIGWVVSRVIMTVFFFVVITPIGLLFRVLGRDRLRIKHPACNSYWINRTEAESPARYLRQF